MTAREREAYGRPDAAVEAFYAPYSPSDERARIARGAALVVAAELRRLATEMGNLDVECARYARARRRASPRDLTTGAPTARSPSSALLCARAA